MVQPSYQHLLLSCTCLPHPTTWSAWYNHLINTFFFPVPVSHILPPGQHGTTILSTPSSFLYLSPTSYHLVSMVQPSYQPLLLSCTCLPHPTTWSAWYNHLINPFFFPVP